MPYVVRPEKEYDINGAISAYDAGLILRYGVNLETFTPYQLIAGDVSGNDSVMAFDAGLILQYTVGLINSFPVMPDSTHFWRFVPEDFPITLGNWSSAPDSIAYIPLDSDTTDNYWGILYGDVSGNWQPSGTEPDTTEESSDATLTFSSEPIQGKAGEKVILQLLATNCSDIIAMNFTLEFNARVFKALDVLTPTLPENWLIAYNIKHSQIKVALAGSKTIAAEDAIVNLEFELLEQGTYETKNLITIQQASIYEIENKINKPFEEYTFGAPMPEQFNLSQNYPNPFNSQPLIQYQVPSSIRVTLKVYNHLGQEIKTIVDEEKAPGLYESIWNGCDNNELQVSSGIYFCRIQAGEFMMVRKMLFFR